MNQYLDKMSSCRSSCLSGLRHMGVQLVVHSQDSVRCVEGIVSCAEGGGEEGCSYMVFQRWLAIYQ